MAKKAPTKRASKNKLPDRISEQFVRKGAQKVTERDIKKVTERADDIRNRFSRGGTLRRFMEDLELLLSIVRDYWSGAYRKIPYWAVGAIVFALLYVLNPLDLVPDVIPVVGLLDDAAVVAVCLTLVEQELHDYKHRSFTTTSNGESPDRKLRRGQMQWTGPAQASVPRR